MSKKIIIGTAGHIDHGKTALVKALTGTDTDRLKEEQERGVTIDIGFAFLTDDIAIIDVPGHERFIKNMVAGVSTIDFVLFIIAADDGVMWGGQDGVPVFGERPDMLAMLAELPDLWDINIADYSREMGVSRFIKEGSLEAYVSYVKSITTKPVVSVGRFTSPDTMVSQIKRGIVDFIGAARPSIADPFLPSKIEQGRLDEIRECIGCNNCYVGDTISTPIRCTQNPTMGEEWRRGWHPEKIEARGSDSTVLVIGAGPAGLEATLVAHCPATWGKHRPNI